MKLNFFLKRITFLWILAFSQIFASQTRFVPRFFETNFFVQQMQESGECRDCSKDSFCKIFQAICFENDFDIFDSLELKEFLFFPSIFCLKKTQKNSSVQVFPSNRKFPTEKSQYQLQIILKQTLF